MYLVVMWSSKPVGLAKGYAAALDVARNDAESRYGADVVPQFPAKSQVSHEYGGHPRWVSLNSAYSFLAFPVLGEDEYPPITVRADEKRVKTMAFDLSGVKLVDGSDVEMDIRLQVDMIAVAEVHVRGSARLSITCGECLSDVPVGGWAEHVLGEHAGLEG
jgi:hypothetical protein